MSTIIGKLFISIISHHNDDDIMNNDVLPLINKLPNVVLLIRDNVNSHRLKEYCQSNDIHYTFSKKQLGFGANNNRNFHLAIDLGITEDDWFVLMNPDVVIELDNIKALSESIESRKECIFAINLYRDKEREEFDNSLRYFPQLSSIFNVFMRKPITRHYNKKTLKNYEYIDWAAGSFLVIKFGLYKSLKGFDERYFMYYEDVDLCYRARIFHKEKVVYLKDVNAVHFGAFENRKIFSKHFRWYFKSLILFLFTKLVLTFRLRTSK
jgi:hypothetical protein